jgi:hypothetical protein
MCNCNRLENWIQTSLDKLSLVAATSVEAAQVYHLLRCHHNMVKFW